MRVLPAALLNADRLCLRRYGLPPQTLAELVAGGDDPLVVLLLQLADRHRPLAHRSLPALAPNPVIPGGHPLEHGVGITHGVLADVGRIGMELAAYAKSPGQGAAGSFDRHGGSSSRFPLSDDGLRERSARSVQARQLCATGLGYASQLPCRFQGLDQS